MRQARSLVPSDHLGLHGLNRLLMGLWEESHSPEGRWGPAEHTAWHLGTLTTPTMMMGELQGRDGAESLVPWHPHDAQPGT